MIRLTKLQPRRFALKVKPTAVCLVACVSVGPLVLAACGTKSESLPTPDATNRFTHETLAANKSSYGGMFHPGGMGDAWGVATRPAGAGGHFWVAAGGTSYEYVGDVRNSPDPTLRTLHQDPLTEVEIPGADAKTDASSAGKSTGVLFDGDDVNSPRFRVSTQTATNKDGKEVKFDGAARFVFATTGGKISAWTERATDGTTVRTNGPAQVMFNGSDQLMQFFGVAMSPDYQTLWAADFGPAPQIRQFDSNWKLVPTVGFANPFATGNPVDPADAAKGKSPMPGDPVPFNIETLSGNVFVTYATSGAENEAGKKNASDFEAGEEVALSASEQKNAGGYPDRGKVAEFKPDGSLVRVFNDDKRLNGPWGLAIAPSSFGSLAGSLLVGSFDGLGRIAAFDISTGAFIDYLRDDKGKVLDVEGVWGLVPGNGVSLGDSSALYYAAGPNTEKDGLFGVIRHAG